MVCGFSDCPAIGTRPAIGSRGPRPSAKKFDGACARTFIWRTMSGKTSRGEPVLFCPRKPKMAINAIVNRSESKRKPRIILVLVHDGDVLAAGSLEQFLRFHFGETRIARLDREKESVVSRALETFLVENRVVPTRQPLHDLPGEESGKGREEHGQFKHDREKRGDRPPIVRFSVNNERVDEPGRAELDRDGRQ